MLPFSYNENRLFLLPVDPTTQYTYWDFSTETWAFLEKEGHHELLLILIGPKDRQRIVINRQTRDYYFRNLQSNTPYRVRLAFQGVGGPETILETLEIPTPADEPSNNLFFRTMKFKFIEPPEKVGGTIKNWQPRLFSLYAQEGELPEENAETPTSGNWSPGTKDHPAFKEGMTQKEWEWYYFNHGPDGFDHMAGSGHLGGSSSFVPSQQVKEDNND